MQIRFSVDGQIQLSKVFLRISTAIQDWTPALSKSAEDLIEILSYDVFETEGGAIGAVWAPLSIEYAKQKERNWPGQGILTASGLMRDSFTSIVDSTSLTIGNSAEYFKFHQSSAPRTKLPRRVMLRLNQDMKDMVVKNFHTQLMEDASV